MMMFVKSKFSMEPDEMMELMKTLNNEFRTLFHTLSVRYGWKLHPKDWHAQLPEEWHVPSEDAQKEETSNLGRGSVGSGNEASQAPPDTDADELIEV